jgi:predicted nucleic acid-binding protein
MSAYPDTSFLMSLYVRDGNSTAALAWAQAGRRSLPFTPLHRHELRNAVLLAVFRGWFGETTAHHVLADIDADVAAGSLAPTPLDWHDALRDAERIGDVHTARHGLRSLDLLHLGAARSLGARTILTFDQRQAAAARAAGFQVGP